MGLAELHEAVDVLVVGGGSAGTIAAAQAGRAGVRTSLIEMSGILGGTTTAGGVTAPAFFYCGPRQVIAGFGWELVKAAKALDSSPLPDFNIPHPTRPSYQIPINPGVYAALAEELLLDAGVILHYHELPIAARPLPEGGYEVTSIGKGLRRVTRCRELIDCTGDADMVGFLGYAREDSEKRQPGTLIYHLTGYDANALNEAEVQAHYDEALASGVLQPGDFYHKDRPFLVYLKARGGNQQHIFNADSRTADTQTKANILGRQSMLRMLRFVRTLPGCEKARLEKMCSFTAVRETWRIVGECRSHGVHQ